MRFVGEGNCKSDKLQGDLIITLTEQGHESIRRVGNDLVYRHKVSLADALANSVIEFKTLDGEIIKYRPD